MTNAYAKHWLLDPNVTFLNHGSFGACPRVTLEAQHAWRERLERQPVHFLMRDVEGALDKARQSLAGVLKAPPEDVAFVTNATTGVNAVLRSLEFEPGDEILITSHGYNACNNAARFVADRAGACVTVADIPFPLAHADEALDAILAVTTDRTKLAVIDHVTSATALVLPIQKIVAALRQRGIDTLVDGAHAPGMVELDVPAIEPAYYTGNCHKWLCGPKSAGFLYVRPDLQNNIRPTVISHGMNSMRVNCDTHRRSRFLLEFDWTGTTDPTPILAIPSAIDFLNDLKPGGLTQLMNDNRALALEARRILCDALNIAPPCPDDMIGSMATVSLPDEREGERFPGRSVDTLNPIEPLQNALLEEYGIEVPIATWPERPSRQVRVSAQAYNGPADYRVLAEALVGLLEG
jgi:isopenicillin-N epimerase